MLTLVWIDDYEGRQDRLEGAVRSVEQRLGIPVRKSAEPQPRGEKTFA